MKQITIYFVGNEHKYFRIEDVGRTNSVSEETLLDIKAWLEKDTNEPLKVLKNDGAGVVLLKQNILYAEWKN